VVLCTYVVNVLFSPAARVSCLAEAAGWLADDGWLVVAARDEDGLPGGWLLGDGVVTSADTFQRGWTVDSFRSWLAQDCQLAGGVVSGPGYVQARVRGL